MSTKPTFLNFEDLQQSSTVYHQNTGHNTGPIYQPIMYEEEISEFSDFKIKDQNSISNSTTQNVQIAIDDYINPEDPIMIDKRQNQMRKVYEEMIKKREAERKMIGLRKKKKLRTKNGEKIQYNRHYFKEEKRKKKIKKKKKKGYESTNRHIIGGWNTDTRTVGVFDPILTKNELDDGLTRQRINKPVRGRFIEERLESALVRRGDEKANYRDNVKLGGLGDLEFENGDDFGEGNDEKRTLYFTDINQLNEFMEELDDDQLRAKAETKIMELKRIEDDLNKEKRISKVKKNFLKIFFRSNIRII